LLNQGRRLYLPPIGNFETPLPAGAATPPERRPFFGDYRPDYQGPRWEQADVDTINTLAGMPNLWGIDGGDGADTTTPTDDEDDTVGPMVEI